MRFSNSRLLITGVLIIVAHSGFAKVDLRLDPFEQPQKAKLVESQTLALKGIVYAGAHSQANISGTVVSIGQEIAGYEIASIEANRVVLLKDEQQVELTLEPISETEGNAKQ